MLKQEEKPTLELLTEEANRQIARQIPKGRKNEYGMAAGSVLHELRRLYTDFENLLGPYYVLVRKGYGNCAIFSYKRDQPLKIEVSVKDFGTDFQCNFLGIVQETPSIEISRIPKLSKETRIFFSSNIKGVNPEKREDAIDDALSFVGDVADENGKVKFGVPTGKGLYGVTMPKEILPLLTIRFLKGDFRLEKELGSTVRRQFNV